MRRPLLRQGDSIKLRTSSTNENRACRRLPRHNSHAIETPQTNVCPARSRATTSSPRSHLNPTPCDPGYPLDLPQCFPALACPGPAVSVRLIDPLFCWLEGSHHAAGFDWPLAVASDEVRRAPEDAGVGNGAVPAWG